MNIIRADKKNIQKGTAAAKKRTKKDKSLYQSFFLQNLSVCGGYRQQQHRIHVHTGFSTV